MLCPRSLLTAPYAGVSQNSDSASSYWIAYMSGAGPAAVRWTCRQSSDRLRLLGCDIRRCLSLIDVRYCQAC
jgi:hypothetical protein